MNKQSSKSVGPGTSAQMSVRDFTEWGVPNVAYIKPVMINNITAYAIFAANGQQIGMSANREVARAAVIQNDLEPVNVH
ncbi:MAG: DUF1150 family protein [Proteobacteria bacterium]|nr:DUF1150 family protein [Pseudomonadota bacterium]